MKRMPTEYRVGPRSSVPPCARFLCLPSQGAQDAISEAAERDLSAAATSVAFTKYLVNYVFLDNRRCVFWTTGVAAPVKCGAMGRTFYDTCASCARRDGLHFFWTNQRSVK